MRLSVACQPTCFSQTSSVTMSERKTPASPSVWNEIPLRSWQRFFTDHSIHVFQAKSAKFLERDGRRSLASSVNHMRLRPRLTSNGMRRRRLATTYVSPTSTFTSTQGIANSTLLCRVVKRKRKRSSYFITQLDRSLGPTSRHIAKLIPSPPCPGTLSISCPLFP